ncbi:MAG: methionyl-tRNA formyltransferase, partial [Burkholderiaceae bacterium]|nr:methionyl-tRNA formyltransferase [Burkholderiaceae bacterium]
RTLDALKRGPVPRRAQEADKATYAPKILKQEATLDFSQPAKAVAGKIRAFNPFPGAQALCGDTVVKIWRASALPGTSTQPAGSIIAANGREGVLVACGDGILRLEEMQKAGGKRLGSEEFIKGFPLENARLS